MLWTRKLHERLRGVWISAERLQIMSHCLKHQTNTRRSINRGSFTKHTITTTSQWGSEMVERGNGIRSEETNVFTTEKVETRHYITINCKSLCAASTQTKFPTYKDVIVTEPEATSVQSLSHEVGLAAISDFPSTFFKRTVWELIWRDIWPLVSWRAAGDNGTQVQTFTGSVVPSL